MSDVSQRKQDEAELPRSRERLEAVLNSLREGVFTVDPQGNLLSWNPAALRLFGYTRDEEVQRHLKDLAKVFQVFSMDDRALSVEEWPISRILKGETLTNLELKFHREDIGLTCFTSYSGAPIRNAAGEIVLGVVTVRDITERKQTEQALRESEERFQLFMDNSPTVAWIKDEQGRHVYLSKTYEERFGVRLADWRGKTDAELQPADVAAQLRKSDLAVLAAGRTIQMTVEVTHPDGTWSCWLCSKFPFRDKAGQCFVACIGVDITERKRLEAELVLRAEELERSNEQLRQSEQRQSALLSQVRAINRELDDFASIVAHDLKAPLRGVSTIAGWLQTDYAGVLDEQGRQRLAQLKQRVGRMDRMIEEILKYSRLGWTEERREPVALAELLSIVLHDLAPPPHVRIHIASGPPVVHGEPVRLRQVFQNLISNAIKYADKPEVDIGVEWMDLGPMWEFRVTDNGPGIEERHFERIFRMFQTLVPKDRTDSTGVGLALVKRIVERAGGRVWVESRLGSGSTFHFTWPKGQGEDAGMPESMEQGVRSKWQGEDAGRMAA